MGRIGSNLTAATLLLMCASSATGQEQRAGARTAENFAKVTVSKTTAGEARALLGPPDRNLKLRANRGETWGYRHGGKYAARMFWIEFSPDGVAREVSDTADFDADKRYIGP